MVGAWASARASRPRRRRRSAARRRLAGPPGGTDIARSARGRRRAARDRGPRTSGTARYRARARSRSRHTPDTPPWGDRPCARCRRSARTRSRPPLPAEGASESRCRRMGRSGPRPARRRSLLALLRCRRGPASWLAREHDRPQLFEVLFRQVARVSRERLEHVRPEHQPVDGVGKLAECKSSSL